MAEARTAVGTFVGSDAGAWLGIPYGRAERWQAPVPCAPLEGPALDDVAPGSRVFLTDNDAAPALTAALIGRGCSVLVVRGGDEQTRSARCASEAIDTSL